MSETIIVIWVSAVCVIGLNGFAAGVVALLHVRRRRMRQGGKIMLASTIAGALPASMMIVVPLAQDGAGEEPIIWLLAFGITLGVAAVVSLPGALILARKLEKPWDEYRAFE